MTNDKEITDACAANKSTLVRICTHNLNMQKLNSYVLLTIYSAATMPSTMAQKKQEITPRLMKMMEATNCERKNKTNEQKQMERLEAEEQSKNIPISMETVFM